MSCTASRSGGPRLTTMKNPKHNSLYGWTGASHDASGVLRGAFTGGMDAVFLRDMVKN